MEQAGIPTVIIGIEAFRPTLEAMSLPRVLLTPNLMGRTISYPGEVQRQREVLLEAINLLENAEQGHLG